MLADETKRKLIKHSNAIDDKYVREAEKERKELLKDIFLGLLVLTAMILTIWR